MSRYPKPGELGRGPDRFYCFEQGDPHYFERMLKQELYVRTKGGTDKQSDVRKEIAAAWELTAERLWQASQETGNPEPVIWTA